MVNNTKFYMNITKLSTTC